MDQRTARQVLAAQTAYDRLVADTRAKVTAAVRRAWLASGQYRDADIERLLDRVVPMVAAGEWTVAQLTSAYLAQMVGLHGGSVVRAEPVSRALVTGEGVRGVDPRVVYRRPAVTLYTALANGVSYAESVNRGLTRLTELAGTDMQLARTRTVAASTRIPRFKRTLSGLENCTLCALASQHTYNRGDLMPIHGHCDCGVIPIFTGHEPEPETGYEVHQHGELGPVLTVEGQHFTGPDDL